MTSPILEPQRKRPALSFIQCVSAIAVVILHTNGGFWSFENTVYWKVSNLIESIFYFAVPVFFMISGATLFDFRERYGIGTFFRNAFGKR